jgi:hypothetical protein
LELRVPTFCPIFQIFIFCAVGDFEQAQLGEHIEIGGFQTDTSPRLHGAGELLI